MYIVKDIMEHDFGCEGLPDGQEYYVDVILTDIDTNKNITVQYSDNELYRKEIVPGDKVTFENGNLKKI